MVPSRTGSFVLVCVFGFCRITSSCAPNQPPPGSGGAPGGSGESSSGGSTTMSVSLSYMPSLKWTYPSSPDNMQDGQSPDLESAKGAIDSSLMRSVRSALDQMGISPSQLSVTSDIVPIEGPAKPGCFIVAKGVAVAIAEDCYDPVTFKPLGEAAFVHIKLANTLTSKQRHDFAFFWFGMLFQEGIIIFEPIQMKLTLICVASSIDAFFFSSSSYVEIKNGNLTCIIKDGELTVNNVSRGNLTSGQQEELELYKKAVEEWSKWWITKALENFGHFLGSIFGSGGSLWHGFGLWGKDNKANVTTSTLPPPSGESHHFPEPPSFCQY